MLGDHAKFSLGAVLSRLKEAAGVMDAVGLGAHNDESSTERREASHLLPNRQCTY